MPINALGSGPSPLTATGIAGVTPQGGLAGATAAPPPPSLGTLTEPALAVPPQAALANLITAAAIAQDGLSGLFADLTAAQGALSLPDALKPVIQQALASQPPLNAHVTGSELQAAVTNSGLFLEAQLAQGLGGNTVPAVTTDFKAVLLQLAQGLGALLEADPAAVALLAEGSVPPPAGSSSLARSGGRPPPPLRGGVTLGQSAASPLIDPQIPEDRLVRVLDHGVRSALARLELSQAASAKLDDGSSFWKFELPVAAPDGPAMAQFEISRDAPGHGGGGDASATWRTRFAVNVTPSGPVQAELALSGDTLHVTLWADDTDTRALLASDRAALVDALRAEGLSEAAVRIAPGAPTPPPAPAAGALLDRST
jgi:hypothetical protein